MNRLTVGSDATETVAGMGAQSRRRQREAGRGISKAGKFLRGRFRCLEVRPAAAVIMFWGMVAVTGRVEGATHYVWTGSPSPAAPYTNWQTAAHTLQEAVDAALPGDTVLATNGVYDSGGRVAPGQSLSNRVCITNNITLRSVNGADVTFISGAGPLGTNAARCVYLSAGATLEGFTLTNGHTQATGDDDNTRGGGVFCADTGTVLACVITGCEGHLGGGAWGGCFENCLFCGNHASGYGGGMYGASLFNCTVTSNSATYAGGGTSLGSARNSIIYYNSAGSSDPNHNAGDISYCCTWPISTGEGNITNEPLFVDRAGGDFRLTRQSPCVDRGLNSAVSAACDLDGLPRIVGGVVDMGAYERQYVHYVSPSGGHVSPFLSWADAATNIQAAVDIASPGDEVWVTNGVYASGGRAIAGYTLVTRLIITNEVTVRSMNGPAHTSIVGAGPNGASAVRCAYLGSNAVLEGFTLTNGHTYTTGDLIYDRSGGGALMESNAVLRNCIVCNGGASHLAAGVYAQGGRLEGCLVEDNDCDGWVGGVHNGDLVNCTVVGNHAANDAGGTFSGELRNCIVWSNTAGGGYPNWQGGDIGWTCTTPLPAGAGDITNDPLFVDAAGGDYRLQRGSPCVDAGTNGPVTWDEDLDGRPRIAGEVVDMGAYERQYVHYVSPSGGHVSPFLSWADAATNIQAALDAASPGDVVLVSNGVYDTGSRLVPGHATPCRVVVTQDVSVISVNGPEDTAIVGGKEPDVRAVYMSAGFLSGFTVTNGAGSTLDEDGAGIFAAGGTVSNCVITGNSGRYGGGMYGGIVRNSRFVGNEAGYGGGAAAVEAWDCDFIGNHGDGGGVCSSRVFRCTFSGNTGVYGAGAYDSYLESCTVVSNSADDNGGGMYGGSAVNSLLYGNSANRGGGAYASYLTNCTVVENSAVLLGGGVDGAGSGGVYNSIIYYNHAPSNPDLNVQEYYCCSRDQTTEPPVGSITNPPLFVDADSGDFHLLSSSPCVDSGSNGYVTVTNDMDGLPRILGGTVDMGCYEQARNPAFSAPEISAPEEIPAGWHWRLAVDGDTGWIIGVKTAGTLVAWAAPGTVETTNGVEQTLAGTVWSNAVSLSGFTDGQWRTVRYITWDADGSERSREETVLEVLRTDKVPDVETTGDDYYVVGYATTAVVWSVSNNDAVVGTMWASNLLNGFVCSFAAGSPTTDVIQLDPGINHVWVFGTNIYGCLAADHRTVCRRPIAAYVAPGGSNVYPYLSWADAATNIQAAVDADEPDGGTVWLTGATYAVQSPVTVSNAITVRGYGGPDDVVVDGGGVSRCFTLLHSNACLMDVTISNGWGGNGGGAYLAAGEISNCVLVSCTATNGGGAYIVNGAIVGCTVTENAATNSGGGVFLNGGTARGCFFRGNRAKYGGGLYVYVGHVAGCTMTGNHATVRGGGMELFGWDASRCIVQGNSADGNGGGVYIPSDGYMTNCLVTGNQSGGDGGGVCVPGENMAWMQFCTVVDNTAAATGGGVAHVSIRNCIVYFNSAPVSSNFYGSDYNYSCLAPVPPSADNTDEDPSFLDWEAGDYHLRYGSPCVDSADPYASESSDLDDNPRPVEGDFNVIPRSDMGCYEYDPAAADSDGDGMDDTWEHGYGLNPTNAADANQDSDGDHVDNGEEYVADTVPTNAASYFHITSMDHSNSCTVTFACTNSRVYSLQTATNVAGGEWLMVEGQTNVTGDASGVMSLTDTNTADMCSYRVGVQVP